ncbi:MAG: CoA synthetase [Thermodesulfobacteriota bacterium]
MNYTVKELMVTVLARELNDNEVGYVGAAAAIPLMACLLAQRTHAPGLILSGLVVNPRAEVLFPSAFDYRYLTRAEAWADCWDIFVESERGVDFMFYSGIQIDQRGNVNLNRVGPKSQPRLQGPGMGNSALGINCRRFYIYHARHRKETFVPEVDFISVPGTLVNGRPRAELAVYGRGPELCVTPLAVMGFEEGGTMRVKSIHPGVTWEQLQQNTGFPLDSPSTPSVTGQPTEEEISVLRGIDRTGLLRSD